MPRPRKPRKCACPDRSSISAVFKPSGTTLKEIDLITLPQDELEALYLCDSEDLTQEEAGKCMGVSRGTVQRLIAAGRKKVAYALVHKMAISIGDPDLAGDLKSVDVVQQRIMGSGNE